MDANRTRYHLLQGAQDWPRWRSPGGTLAKDSLEQVFFDTARQDITLWPLAFRFPATSDDRALTADDRRGAARDAFANTYFIAEDRQSVRVRSAGSDAVSTFWPAPGAGIDADPARSSGGFTAIDAAPSPHWTLQGLAVTEDHYLVAGCLGPGGLLVFDLYAGGPPRQRLWPADVPFAPWDMVPRQGGGVWVLDRRQRRVWPLDRRFEVVGLAAPSPPVSAPFGPGAPQQAIPRAALHLSQGWPVPASDVVALDALDDGSVLVLEPAGADGQATVHWLADGLPVGAPASTADLAHHQGPAGLVSPWQFIGHDLALGPRQADDPADWLGRLYIVGSDGNQAYAFGLQPRAGGLWLDALPEYYPMRLFGGRALVASAGVPHYDCADRWLPLMAQQRPRYQQAGELLSPLLDGADPGCVWHRLMLDASLPADARLEVWSRAADDWRALAAWDRFSADEREALGLPASPPADDALAPAALGWVREPDPYLRADGPERPGLALDSGGNCGGGGGTSGTAGTAGTWGTWGTWELLFQRARGRYLQLRLVLRGDGRSTPRLRALRAWYPRFSYAEHYLPAVYREDPVAASFIERLLANFEGTYTTIEDRIAQAQWLFDARSTAPEALDWLAGWFGVALDAGWSAERKRLFIRHAMDFFARRGTLAGLQMALRLALDACVDERLFAAPTAANAATAAARSSVRIIEHFRARRTPPALLGEVSTAVPGPRLIATGTPWTPALGGANLHQRYASTLGLPPGTRFPLQAPADAGQASAWAGFAQRELGFVPSAGRQADDAARWQRFLARRYRSVASLNTAWRVNWPTLDAVPLYTSLPPDGPALADWHRFEGTVLAMRDHAHRFSVMLAVPPGLRTDSAAQQRRLALAAAVLALEKPAHTTFTLRFYWAMFRLGEARLGQDSLIDLGSRSPQLMAPMVLGEGALAQSFLAAPAGRDAPQRLRIGRDRVGRSARLGGP